MRTLMFVLALFALVPENALARGAAGYPPPDWTCSAWSLWRKEGVNLVRTRDCWSPSGTGAATYHDRRRPRSRATYPPRFASCSPWSTWKQAGLQLTRTRVCRNADGRRTRISHTKRLRPFCLDETTGRWHYCRR